MYNLATYTEKDISKLIAQMFAALQYLHSLNIVHRNVKPTNIIVRISLSLSLSLSLSALQTDTVVVYPPTGSRPLSGYEHTPTSP